jgi:hypothetical protein
MLMILQAETVEHRRCARELLGEHLEGVCGRLNSECNASLDHELILEEDMVKLRRLSSPHSVRSNPTRRVRSLRSFDQ